MSVWSEIRDRANGEVEEPNDKMTSANSEKEENKPISQKEQLWAISASIILSGMVSNDRYHHPTEDKIEEAKKAAKKLLDGILE